ncbi:MAG: hypothetical protein M3069_04050 [Chloroflexota bacterium]|nr:hypothetical protein [Chloroflexota bacterium]
MAALRTLWKALVGLYEETLVLVLGNLAALAFNVPLGLVLVLAGLPFAGAGEDGGGPQWLLLVVAWMLPFLPTPGNVALSGLALVAAGTDAPRFGQFRTSLRAHWRLALRCLLLSLIVLVALLANVYFYAVLSTGWLRFISIVWLYGALFWLSLHLYLVPLLVYVAEPRLVDLYRRAGLIALGHPAYTLVLLLPLLIVGFVSVVFLPVYVLITNAFVSLVQAHALREVRRRHGELVDEPEEEGSRL